MTHNDDGFKEIQLNGKQLVFLFMAATVVSVVIFLCGVLVGRGVRTERAAEALQALTDGPSADTAPSSSTTSPAPGLDPTKASTPPPPVDDLSYFDRLEKSTAPAEALDSKGAPGTQETMKRTAEGTARMRSTSGVDSGASLPITRGSRDRAKPGSDVVESHDEPPVAAPRTRPTPPVASAAAATAPRVASDTKAGAASTKAALEPKPGRIMPEGKTGSVSPATATPMTTPAAASGVTSDPKAGSSAAAMASANTPGAAPAPKSDYAVQVAALNARGEADAVAQKLSSKGYSAYVLASSTGALSVYRVRVGPFKTRRDAESMASRLQREEQFKPWITR